MAGWRRRRARARPSSAGPTAMRRCVRRSPPAGRRGGLTGTTVVSPARTPTCSSCRPSTRRVWNTGSFMSTGNDRQAPNQLDISWVPTIIRALRDWQVFRTYRPTSAASILVDHSAHVAVGREELLAGAPRRFSKEQRDRVLCQVRGRCFNESVSVLRGEPASTSRSRDTQADGQAQAETDRRYSCQG